jgi:hypothetical protein
MPEFTRQTKITAIAPLPNSATVPALVLGGLWGRRGPCRPPVQQTTRSNNCTFPDGHYCDMMADVISSRNAPKGWKRPFEDPIPLPRGRQLVTLAGLSFSKAAAPSRCCG